jgi:hypothetical protein
MHLNISNFILFNFCFINLKMSLICAHISIFLSLALRIQAVTENAGKIKHFNSIPFSLRSTDQ